MAKPLPLSGSFTCHGCGQRFSSQYVHRRRTNTARTFTGRSWRIHSRVVSLCPDCNKRETRKTIMRVFLYILVVVAFIAALVALDFIPISVTIH